MSNRIKRVISAVLALAAAASLASCAGPPSSSDGSPSGAASGALSTGSSGAAGDARVRPDDGKKIGYQLDPPAKGEEIAVLETSLGTVKIRLFPDAAPKAVENFKGLMKKGYYNGLTFHRVIKDFMVQTGDPKGDGTGGSSLWNRPFADEFNKNLLNVRGAVAMANSGPDTNGSQFFIDQAGADSFAGWANFEKAYAAFKQSKISVDDFTAQYGTSWIDMDKTTPAYRALYEKYGGNPYLDGAYNLAERGHTVFGQVFKGMNVVDEIASVAVNDSDKPLSPVTIKRAEITAYLP